MKMVTATSSLVLIVSVALTVQVFYFSPIDPVFLEIPLAASSTKNNQLRVKSLLILVIWSAKEFVFIYLLLFSAISHTHPI